MNWQASFMVSDIFRRTRTTDSLRLQNDAVDSFSSCTKLFFVVMTPMAYSLPHMPAKNQLITLSNSFPGLDMCTSGQLLGSVM